MADLQRKEPRAAAAAADAAARADSKAAPDPLQRRQRRRAGVFGDVDAAVELRPSNLLGRLVGIRFDALRSLVLCGFNTGISGTFRKSETAVASGWIRLQKKDARLAPWAAKRRMDRALDMDNLASRIRVPFGAAAFW